MAQQLMTILSGVRRARPEQSFGMKETAEAAGAPSCYHARAQPLTQPDLPSRSRQWRSPLPMRAAQEESSAVAAEGTRSTGAVASRSSGAEAAARGASRSSLLTFPPFPRARQLPSICERPSAENGWPRMSRARRWRPLKATSCIGWPGRCQRSCRGAAASSPSSLTTSCSAPGLLATSLYGTTATSGSARKLSVRGEPQTRSK
mmetsp:Transcript_83551/g.270361  ORF Transcript_83551/g.270361 Transcript_83551/m.270361 type:complete len:204 (-) Transcript_83551:700-1311(-)